MQIKQNIVILLLLFFFIAFALPSDSVSMFREGSASAAISDQLPAEQHYIRAELQLQEEALHSLLPDFYSPARQADIPRNVLKITALLWTILAFSHYAYDERVCFSYAQIDTHLTARYLCELFTLQKKDGKKR